MPNRVISYVFRGDFSNLKAGLTVAGKATKDYADNLTALDANGRKMRAGLAQVGGTAGKVGLAAAAGLGAAVAAAANFDKSMSAVQAATHESTSNMEQLRKAALKAGQDTVYSATESAGAIEELAKAGVSTKDILGGGLNGALSLAAAGALDVGEAAETAASAMTQFKLSGDQVPHIADLLAAGAGKAQGSVHDLGMALNQAGLVASQTGLSVEETTGTLAAFASAGLTGSDAGTSFKTMLQALTPSSKQAADLMSELGISAYDAQGNFVGMAKFAGVLQSALSGLSVEQQNAALKTIFGSDAVRAASVIFQQGSTGVQAWIDKTNDAGYAAETASTRLDNLAGDFEQLKGSLETALIGTGDGGQGPLRSLTQGATDLVNAYNNLPGAAKGATAALLGVTAVVGGGAWFGSKVVKGIADTKQALSDLGIEAGKAKGALGGIARAGVGIGTLVVSLNLAQEAIEKIANTRIDSNGLNRDLTALADGRVTGNLKNVGQALADMGNKWQRDANPLSWVSSWDPSGFEAAQDTVKSLDDALASMVESGNADTAAAAFAELVKSGSKLGVSADEAAKYFPGYATALENAGDAATTAAPEVDKLAMSTTGLGKNADGTARSIEDIVKAMENQRSAALGAFDAVTQYGQALQSAKDAAAKGKRGIDANTEAGRENRQALSELAAAWNNQSDAVRNNSGKFKQARRDFIETATAMGVPIGQARRLAKQLLEIPNKVATKVAVDTSQATPGLSAVKRALDALHDKTVTIHTVRQGAGLAKQSDVQDSRQHAAGGYIVGPGTATSDDIPAWLSNGEYVVKAASVAKYGVAMFDSINAGRFASGGLAGARQVAASFGVNVPVSLSTARELKRFEMALDKATKALDDEKSARERVSDTIKSALTVDLFGSTGGSAFSKKFSENSIAGANANLAQQIRNAQEFERIEKQLRRRGVSGTALQEILAGGIDRARAAAAASDTDLRTYQSSYNTAQALTAHAAAVGADMVRGGNRVPVLEHKVDVLTAAVKALDKNQDKRHKESKADRAKNAQATGHHVTKGLNSSAKNSRRR